MSPARIVLLPVGPLRLDPGLLPWLAAELAAAWGVSAAPAPGLPLDDAWLDPDRGQYRSDRIVDELIRRDDREGGPAPAGWTLAVTDADVAPPGRDFVFGEATVGGAWALIALARLADAGPDRLRERALKEALHELGHVAGLDHCDHGACVMRPARTAADVDGRPARFCGPCRTRLRTPGQP